MKLKIFFLIKARNLCKQIAGFLFENWGSDARRWYTG